MHNFMSVCQAELKQKVAQQFYMASLQLQKFGDRPQHQLALAKGHKQEQQKRQDLLEYDNQQSQFMHPLVENKQTQGKNPIKSAPKVNKSVVLSKAQVQSSLTQIYSFYAKAYLRPVKQFSMFTEIEPQKMNMQSYFLFCKHFRILKAIFNIQKLTLIFKKHADYGKVLSFDNFYFMINSMSHEAEAKQYFHLEQMTKNLDVETAQELERQEFYNYIQLGSPQNYRYCFKEIFLPFNMKENPNTSKLDYHYRKFSLPELRKRAIPDQKSARKGQKDLFIVKHDKTTEHNNEHNLFDQAKSIVVSWDSLRAKSVNNLGQPAQLVQRKYLKADPEQDAYLKEVRPSSRKQLAARQAQADNRHNRFMKGSKIEKKIKQIEENERAKNNKILERIEKKVGAKSGRVLII